jgi:hypothetical protein
MTEEAEEKRQDELEKLFPELIDLKQKEDLLLGFPVTKYDPAKKKAYKLYPNGEKIYV